MSSTSLQNSKTMQDLLGPNLLTSLHTSKSTSEVLKGKDLICLYFSASWCPPCKKFTPILSSFYDAHCRPANIEIIYISSDSDVTSFEAYYGKMPWCSLPVTNTAQIKQKLADKLKISGIPTLVVLDSKGNFVSDTARNDVMLVGNSVEKGKELVDRWKTAEAVPIEEAQLSGTGQGGILWRIVMTFLRNPMYIVGLLFFVKKFMRKLQNVEQREEF